MPPFSRLEQEEHRRSEHSAVAKVACEKQHDAHHGEKQQHVASREECRIERGEARQQHQPPQEPVAEVSAPLPRVVHLQVEGEAEQQGESGVCLARKESEDRAEHPIVKRTEPPRPASGYTGKMKCSRL